MFKLKDKNNKRECNNLKLLHYWSNLLKLLILTAQDNNKFLYLIDNKFNKYRISVELGQLWCLLWVGNRDQNSLKENNH